MQENNNIAIKVIIISFIIVALGAAAYWYFVINQPVTVITAPTEEPTGFTPFGRTSTVGGRAATSTATSSRTGQGQRTGTTTVSVIQKLPTLRLLSETPVGGYAASTTGTTTVVRWVDRGRGNIMQVTEGLTGSITLSNTIVPRIYESAWNKDITAFVAEALQDNTSKPNFIFAELKKRSASASSSDAAPFELKGKALSDNLVYVAASPKRDKILLVATTNGRSVGYISGFDGKTGSQAFDIPLQQINIEWPSDDIISITTKAMSGHSGFWYLYNVKSGELSKAAGPVPGLAVKVSRDGKYALVTAAQSDTGTVTGIYDITKKTTNDSLIQTIADKCAWGNFYKNIVYCAVPSEQETGAYPDGWYRGTAASADKLWQIDAATGEARMVSSIIDQSDRLIDAYNLGLDPKDQYLFFMNKNDLSLWSLDLTTSPIR